MYERMEIPGSDPVFRADLLLINFGVNNRHQQAPQSCWLCCHCSCRASLHNLWDLKFEGGWIFPSYGHHIGQSHWHILLLVLIVITYIAISRRLLGYKGLTLTLSILIPRDRFMMRVGMTSQGCIGFYIPWPQDFPSPFVSANFRLNK